MTRGMGRGPALLAALICLLPVAAGAQTPSAATPSSATPADRSRMWIVAGGAATTLRGDCQDCPEPGAYIHAGSVLVGAGRRVTTRMDAGVEVLWVPATAASGSRVRSTFVVAAAQFRPWESQGFFLKAGMGMTFVRNWIYDGSGELPPVTSKALGLTYSAGWQFRRHDRASLQIIGSQHVAALGDFQTNSSTIENVVGNFWSIGAALVIR